ncbi:hypothetical protein [Geodermatophilus sabuli]|uniref:Prenyltransferase and squalene oxidase repeat-containing protein n=1 Tax=Geodermatophilus sabuli TaxID=1564158 RepID=A0A285EFD4_9ACTN|nr:hypothetical protein [Geodermatophilus sabuli]MBB3086210.1 hypothetical protein [Geodermatophilus sabuli]SNX97573.1 hypothetical protein SAMN06893097_107217 [Geodermatophilus sabuli]
MSVDLSAAADFMAGHARLLDRRRFERLFTDGDGDAVLVAVEAYRNPDGGYGWGLEPDLRSRTSQPGGALHAFEAFADAAPATTERARALCDWCATVALPDGGLPFALAVPDPAGCAPFWASADATSSSLQITAIVAAAAHQVAEHDPAVAGHPWLARATGYCLDAVRQLGPEPHALELAFAVRLLDAAHATHPEAAELLDRLGQHVPADGLVHVAGGAEEEFMRALDFAPHPGSPARALVTAEAVERELERLAAQQQDDGGWRVDFDSYSPAAGLEWRGHRTVEALGILRANGVL